MKKFTIYNLQFTIIAFICALYIVHYTLYIPLTFAQAPACPAQSPNPRVTNGLISTSALSSNKFGSSTGNCVVDSQKVAFAPYKIPEYADLKSLYYTQSNAPKTSSTNTNISPITSTDDGKIFNYTASEVNINGTYNYNGTAVIFINGNLTINQNINALDPAKGLVFVVGGNVLIDKTVTRIDAVIISGGMIYTATDASVPATNPASSSCSTSAVTTNNSLVINGSLISLNQNDASPIKFCRSLTNNNQPAEQIVYQPKYLVILRNLFANTLQKWSEIQ